MLLALSIRDFAIIDAVTLELGPGMTAITGETGAGKSILVGALDLVLGGRASADLIRKGSERATVEALFSLEGAGEEGAGEEGAGEEGTGGLREQLQAAGIGADDQLVVRRVIARSGRHRVYLNDHLSTVSALARLTRGLIDISGQAAHYSLLRPDFHLQVLDVVADLGALRGALRGHHDHVAALDARLETLEAQQREQASREGYLRFQLEELEAAAIAGAGEEETLEREARLLRNTGRLVEGAVEAEQALYQANGSVVERLDRVERTVAALVELDESLAEPCEELRTARILTEEAARSLGAYARQIAAAADPAKLDEIEARLALFARLRRKHGATLAQILDTQGALREELDALCSLEQTLEAARQARREAAPELAAQARALSAARREGADRLAAAVKAELEDLGMEGATLLVDLRPLRSGVEVDGLRVGPRGADRIELLLSANPGEDPQPLARIASGGELSRFMLAVKRVIAAQDPVSTYVFDEVDAGVGGPTAEAIGRKLKAVSADRQVLCVTHLPQIAAFADRQLVVRKRVLGDRTLSQVAPIEGVARVEELARMLGGATITPTTRAHAEELLRHANTAQ